MRKTLCLLALLLLVFTGSSFGEQGVSNVQVNISMDENAHTMIEELITVYGDQTSLVRTLPLHFDTHNHPLQNIKVIDPLTKNPIKYKVIERANEKQLEIELPKKGGSVQLSYELDFQENGSFINERIIFPIGDAKWDLYVPQMSFTLTLPKEMNLEERVSYEITNSLEVDSEAMINTIVQSNKVFGDVSHLYPYQNVQLKIDFSKNYFLYDTTNYSTTRYVIIAVILILISGSAFFLSDLLRKKNIQPLKNYYFPKGFSILEVDAIVKEDEERMNIPALILSWANRGFVQVHYKNDEYIMHKNYPDLAKDDSDVEKYMYNQLFFKENASLLNLELDPKERKFLVGIKDEVMQSLKDEKNKMNSSQLIPAMIMIFVQVGIAFFLRKDLSVQTGIGQWMSMLILFLFTFLSSVFYVFVFHGRMTIKIVIKNIGVALIYLIPLFCLYLFVAQNGIGNIMEYSSLSFSLRSFVIPWYLWIVFLLTLASISGSILLKVRTIAPSYRKKLQEIFGLREFLSNITEKEINSISFEQKNYYSKMFEYVVLFGLCEKWHTLKIRVDDPNPSWFVSDEPFELEHFVKAVEEVLS